MRCSDVRADINALYFKHRSWMDHLVVSFLCSICLHCVCLASRLIQNTGYGGHCYNSTCAAGSWEDTAGAWYEQNLQISIPVTIIAGVVVGCFYNALAQDSSCSARSSPASFFLDGVYCDAASVPKNQLRSKTNPCHSFNMNAHPPNHCVRPLSDRLTG